MSYLQAPPSPPPFNVGEKNVGEKEYIAYLTNIEWGRGTGRGYITFLTYVCWTCNVIYYFHSVSLLYNCIKCFNNFDQDCLRMECRIFCKNCRKFSSVSDQEMN